MSVAAELNDVEVLAGLGYKQELKRAFRPLEVVWMAFSVIGLFPSITQVRVVFELVPPEWWFGVSRLGLDCVQRLWHDRCMWASGAQLRCTHSRGSVLLDLQVCVGQMALSIMLGYSNTMGLVAGTASVVWACAVQLMAAVSIGSNLTFTPTISQLYAVFVAIYIVTAILASVATRLLARIQIALACLNVLLCLCIIIAVPAATPADYRNTAVDVFTKISSLNGWQSGFAFVLGFAGPLWVMGGYDGPVHISEEASNANVAVPAAIVSSLGAAILFGFGIFFALAFNMGTDIDAIMNSSIGQPMATILFNSLGTKGTLVVWAFVVLSQFSVGVNCLVTASRQSFAFSRDGALPLSRYLYRINPYTGTPVNCVWAATTVGLILGLLAFAGPTAINAIFTLAIVGSYCSFCIPLSSRLLGGTEWRPGPFTLGKLGAPVTAIAALWNMFAIVVVIFPTTPKPTSNTMNYTVVVGGGWIGLCILYYYLPKYGGVHWFKGPAANVDRHVEGLARWDSTEKDEEDKDFAQN
ncbi:hypothetical protein NM688_g1294 [Phlebia brevispora]|uniref:Uncharacterized protein n=1 Tax=Phlebia brevispora TaxID=194682 RepID=A0ACC1TC09_9APHY|nr:hypothetical protein NM688_g1294 [Phlebia brevispora]